MCLVSNRHRYRAVGELKRFGRPRRGRPQSVLLAEKHKLFLSGLAYAPFGSIVYINYSTVYNVAVVKTLWALDNLCFFCICRSIFAAFPLLYIVNALFLPSKQHIKRRYHNKCPCQIIINGVARRVNNNRPANNQNNC